MRRLLLSLAMLGVGGALMVAAQLAGASSERKGGVFVVGTTRTVRRKVANLQGRFVLRLTNVDLSACAGFSANAVGNRGTRVTLKRPPGQCPKP